MQNSGFREGMRLSQDDVILAWEQFEGIFQEILTSGGETLIHAEQIDHKGIDLLFWDLRYLVQTL